MLGKIYQTRPIDPIGHLVKNGCLGYQVYQEKWLFTIPFFTVTKPNFLQPLNP